eukprot:5624461-Prymnesium_polylepis.1
MCAPPGQRSAVSSRSAPRRAGSALLTSSRYASSGATGAAARAVTPPLPRFSVGCAHVSPSRSGSISCSKRSSAASCTLKP